MAKFKVGQKVYVIVGTVNVRYRAKKLVSEHKMPDKIVRHLVTGRTGISVF